MVISVMKEIIKYETCPENQKVVILMKDLCLIGY
jgi:hypothetical protein